MESWKSSTGDQSGKRPMFQPGTPLFVPSPEISTTPGFSPTPQSTYQSKLFYPPSTSYPSQPSYSSQSQYQPSYQPSYSVPSSTSSFPQTETPSVKQIRQASKERNFVPIEDRINALSRVMGRYIPENQLDQIVYTLKPYQLDMVWDYAWPQIYRESAF